MCGIAGILSLSDGTVVPGRVHAMIDTIRHRGPDDAGVHVDGPAGLGAARLSIIDLLGGHQPIAVANGSIVVAQNGEIYNYLELAKELSDAGCRMATACDTEVIAHLYAAHGLAAFEKLRGMFAIAIWDRPAGRLILARDRVGKKPLYYCESGGELLFGSETKSILAAIARRPDVSASAILSFLTFGYVAGDEAVFDGMRRVPPGCCVIVETGSGRTTLHRYWSWPAPADAPVRREEETIAALRAELTEAVRIRLRSDVPLGAFLSGGIDSAAVLALMARQSSRPVKTFSIGFGDPAYDELDDARFAAERFGAEHHEWRVTPDGIKVAETLAYHYDEPFADASAIPTFYVAELARRHVTVALTGDGGDELFAGYQPYADALGRRGGAALSTWRALLSAGAGALPPHARGKGRLVTAALGPEAWFVWRRTVFPAYLLRQVAHPDLLRRASDLPEREAVRQLTASPGALLGRLQAWDQRHYLPDDILVKVDRATMAHSLEARCPLLDHRVIELAAAQPPDAHGDAHTTKRLFRKVVEPWLPPEILARPKRGFGVPLRRWFHEGMIDWARDILQTPRTRGRGWTRPADVDRLIDQHAAGARDHAKRIWALVSLELWARRHADLPATRELKPCA